MIPRPDTEIPTDIPSDILAPFVPTDRDPFDLAKAGHLLRRASFGGSLAERKRLVSRGVGPAVEGLFLAGSEAGLEDVDVGFDDVLALGSIEQMRSYRVWRMLRGDHRLRERMSFFWHDHFATSNQKVQNPRLMGRQLALFDRLGLGRFDELLRFNNAFEHAVDELGESIPAALQGRP